MNTTNERSITTLIVDVENVLRGGSVKDIPRHFEKIGVDARRLNDALQGRTELPSCFLNFRLGKITPREFRESVKYELLDNGDLLSDEEFDRAFCGIYEHMLLPQNFMAIAKLHRAGLKTVILSNNNPIHTQYFLEQCDEILGVNALNEIFDATLFSYQIGCRKPDAQAYQKALQAVGETNFSCTALLDDKKRNLDAAAALGITPILIPCPDDMVRVLDAHAHRFAVRDVVS